MNEINKQLNNLNKEDFVWYIYFFIIIFALFTNKLEKNYLFTKNKTNKKLAQNINTIILIVALGIYIYFLKVSWQYIQNCKEREKRVALERLIVNILFVVAGSLALYADYDNNTTNTDIGIL